MPLPDLQEPLALLEQKDFGTAVDMLEEKVTALPAHLGAHVLLAHAYEAQRRWDRALEAWENARFLMPNSPIAEAGKRRVLRRMDGIEEDDDHSLFADFPASGAQPTTPTEPSESPPEGASGTDTPAEAGDESPSGDDSGLSQLRDLAEQEARQGGARPGLSDSSSSTDQPSLPEESSTPEEQIERLDEEGETDDLDRLINELQSAQIEPEPDAEAGVPPPADAPGEETPADDTSPEEDVVSETLAKIHAGQNDYQRAAHIYAQLAEQEPDQADEFREKAAEMREKADGTDDDGP